MDEIVINASDHGFDVKSFIDRIKNDTTFYKAFRSMHLVTYNAENDIRVYNKHGKVKASLKSETKQIYRDGCRTMNVLYEKTSGDFYKRNGDYRYFTAKLFADLFFTKGKVCGENNIVKGHLEEETNGKGTIEKSKSRLKQLLFQPGQSVEGVPFIGDKVAIFNPEIAKMYDFRLVTEDKNGVPCYLFEAKPKPAYEKDVVINIFRTWLRQTDYAIVSRDYSLSYNARIYDFNVVMHVDLKKAGDKLLPSFISYNGNWHVLTQDRERVKFTARFDY